MLTCHMLTGVKFLRHQHQTIMSSPLQALVATARDEMQRLVRAKTPQTAAQKDEREDTIYGWMEKNEGEWDQFEESNVRPSLMSGVDGARYELNRKVARKRYEEINTDLVEMTKLLPQLTIDMDATESCDGVVVLSTEITQALSDAHVIELLKKAPDPPFSFKQSAWPAEVKQAPALEMKWEALYRVQWTKLVPDLQAYLLDRKHKPHRRNFKKKWQDFTFDDVDILETPSTSDEDETEVGQTPDTSAGLSYPQMKTFERIKEHVRYDENTGMMHFVAFNAPDLGMRYVCRRIMTDRAKLRTAFNIYWHENSVGAHRRATSLHRRLSEVFLGLSRRALESLITQTELHQLSLKSGTFQKVTNPLQSSRPMEHVQIDLFMIDKRVYANMICHFTKFCWCKEIKNKRSTTIISFCEDVFMVWGHPTIVQSDNGTEFDNSDFRVYCRKSNMVWRASRAYRPQTNGAIERLNKTLKGAMKSAWVISQKMTTEDLMKIVEAYNKCVHSITGYTPFELLTGRRPEWVPHMSDATVNGAMEYAMRRDLFTRFTEANPSISKQWVQDNLPTILSDEVWWLHYWNEFADGVVTIQPPDRFTDTPVVVNVGTGEFVVDTPDKEGNVPDVPVAEVVTISPFKKRPPEGLDDASILPEGAKRARTTTTKPTEPPRTLTRKRVGVPPPGEEFMIGV